MLSLLDSLLKTYGEAAPSPIGSRTSIHWQSPGCHLMSPEHFVRATRAAMTQLCLMQGFARVW